MDGVNFLGVIRRSFNRWPHLYTAALSLLYLALFQTHFLFGGDTWAEAFAEYVRFALEGQWEEFFQLGIAGYFNFLPKILSYTYILNGFPLENIDYFFRATAVAFAVGCTSFIAHPFNRGLVKNDWLRIILAVMTLNLLYHVSSFSFINVWYAGFIPMILVSLNPNKLRREWQQVLYAAFAIAVCLTKPSVILAPLVLYRMVRLREYLLGFTILLAITLQTALFLTSKYYMETADQQVDTLTRLTSMFYATGVIVLKTLQLYPSHVAAVVIAAVLLVGLWLVIGLSKRRWQAVLLATAFAAFLYIYLYSPDALNNIGANNYLQLYNDITKLQRELIPAFLVLLPVFICADILIKRLGRGKFLRLHTAWLVIVPLALLAIWQYRPINALDNKVYMNIDPFRSSLANNQSTCMPVPPSPTWAYREDAPYTGWLYEHYGVCANPNSKKIFDFTTFGRPVGEQFDFTIQNQLDLQIKSLLIPVANPDPSVTKTLVLKNIDTDKTYTAVIRGKPNKEEISFGVFNLAQEDNRSEYNYRLTQKNSADSTLKTGVFKQGGLAYYAYFMPNPNVNDYEHQKARREEKYNKKL